MKNNYEELIQTLVSAAAYTLFNAETAPDKDKEILTAFIDFVNPGLLDELVQKVDTEKTDD